jgi:hypothetical protein
MNSTAPDHSHGPSEQRSITDTSSAIQADMMKFSFNLLASDPSVLELLSALEDKSNENVEPERQSHLYETILAIQTGVDQLLGKFLDRFWDDIKGCPICVRHRFKFDDDAFTHQYRLLALPDAVFQGHCGQRMNDPQIQVRADLERFGSAVGSHPAMPMTLGHHSVRCTGWKVFPEGSGFVCEFDVKT